MKKFKVTASYIVYCYAEVEANSQEEAFEIAQDMDGGSFDIDPKGDDADGWRITDVEPMEDA